MKPLLVVVSKRIQSIEADELNIETPLIKLSSSMVRKASINDKPITNLGKKEIRAQTLPRPVVEPFCIFSLAPGSRGGG